MALSIALVDRAAAQAHALHCHRDGDFNRGKTTRSSDEANDTLDETNGPYGIHEREKENREGDAEAPSRHQDDAEESKETAALDASRRSAVSVGTARHEEAPPVREPR